MAGDTAQGADIYHWRFAPRATTKRNLDWYFWAWNNPESIPWGGQVQDGGAVLGFSYHDLMARLKVARAGQCLEAVAGDLRWFDEVQAAGGYRKYYNGSREGSLQGGGTAAGSASTRSFSRARWFHKSYSRAFSASPPGPMASSSIRAFPRTGRNNGGPDSFQNLILRIRATHEAIEIQQRRRRARAAIPAAAGRGVASGSVAQRRLVPAPGNAAPARE